MCDIMQIINISFALYVANIKPYAQPVRIILKDLFTIRAMRRT